MSPRSALIMLSLTCCLVTCQVAQAYLPRPEARRLCRLRSGLDDRDFADYKTRNEDCTIDCITKQGTMMTAHAEDGTNCHDTEGYKCVLGKCRSPDEKQLDEELKSGGGDLHEVTINIKSAFVADRDPYPTQGESDAFALVELVSEGGPAVKDGEVLCYTHVVQDNSRPKWNFFCKPLPMRGAARLRFIVLDSDKPDTNPQLLGTTTQTLESLLNAGTQTLTLELNGIRGGPYTLDVEIKGKKYSPE